jgi:5-(carboxyamino)imidazole ribonucleotide synthase
MAQRKAAPLAGVVMGSDSDWEIMKHAVAQLDAFGIANEPRVLSAHRMPDEMFEYAEDAGPRGLRVIIAVPAARRTCRHARVARPPSPSSAFLCLRNTCAARIRSSPSCRCRRAFPVATFAIGEAGAANAGLFAVAILAGTDAALARKLAAFRAKQTASARAMRVPPGRTAPMASIPPGAWLGLLGGGQLGRMFCMAAQSLGYRVAVLDPGSEGPAASVADRHIVAGYLDARALEELAALAAAATTEFENVPAASLDFLSHTARVTPSAASVAIAQDRISEKMFLSGHGFALAPFAVLRGVADIDGVDATRLLPGIVKSARFGYDGKGQASVATVDDVRAAWRRMEASACVLERRIALACEVSVIVARNERGETCTWPVAENRHRDGILDVSIIPRVSMPILPPARAKWRRASLRPSITAASCASSCSCRATATCSSTRSRRVRTTAATSRSTRASRRNSSSRHACSPISPSAIRASTRRRVMVNLLGDLWFADEAQSSPREPAWWEVLEHPAAKLHLYGKSEPRRGARWGTSRASARPWRQRSPPRAKSSAHSASRRRRNLECPRRVASRRLPHGAPGSGRPFAGP